jgi:signal transduction histidine kinase/CheY-like chemotaxis protein/HPt (histidine-containing phosphotransfer) domain-containing protein
VANNRPAIIKGALSRLIRLGVKPSMDPRAAKRIILSNQFALTFGCIPLPFMFVDRGPAVRAYDFVISAMYASILVLNGLGFTHAARLTFVILSFAGIFGTNLVLGPQTLIWTFAFPACCYPILLFGREQRKTLVGCVLLCAVLAIGSEYYYSHGGHALKPMTPILPGYRVGILSVSFGVFLLAVFYALRAGNQAEAALAGSVEAAKAADKAKSRFLANMSHEIRTPLNGILGLSDLLARPDAPPNQGESIEAIRSSAQDLLNIINDILDLSKIEAGKMRLESIPFETRKLREGLKQLFAPLAARKSLDLRVEAGPNVPARLIGDPVRIKQVLTNLLGNAIKFTERGYVSVQITLDGPPAENIARLRFQVEDTGVGIPQAAQARLFNAFSQADDTTTRRFGGTGLGLHLSRQMVEMMGGEIGFTSREGEGSRFWFTAPLAVAPEETGPRPQGGIAPARLPEGMRILIVDDHPLNRRVLEAMLEIRGAHPHKASDGLEAIEAVEKQGGFDLILMDSHMPRMDGYEATRRLRNMRATSPGGRPPVIIGFTADAMAGSREKCLAAGMDDMITKPVLEQDLNRALTRWIDGGKAASASVTVRADKGEWIDPGQILEMNEWIRHYEPGFWDKTLGQFDASYRDLFRAIRAACAAGNFHAAGIAAHTLKGACVMLGLRRMGDICNSLEALGMGGDTSLSMALLDSLEAARAPSLQELKKWIS